MNNIITLRSVYGKVKNYYFSPLKGKNGMYPPFVKKTRINANGDSEMILSESEMNSAERDAFVPEDMQIDIVDGTTFDLDNPLQRNMWNSIKDSSLIVPERGARNEKGDLIIDGDKRRYGLAELWIEKPGEESEKRISKIKLITQAYTFIENDSAEGRLTKVKLLGKTMRNAPDSDVQDYLYLKAETSPTQIIDLYTGTDTQLKLLFIEALEKRIIMKVRGVFMYADHALGMTDDSVILYFKNTNNKAILDSLKAETYPEYLKVEKTNPKDSPKGKE